MSEERASLLAGLFDWTREETKEASKSMAKRFGRLHDRMDDDGFGIRALSVVLLAAF